MKKNILLLPFVLLAGSLSAQEIVKELSKSAIKGYVYDVNNNNNELTITYKIPGKKKDDAIVYEAYSFDQNNKFLKAEKISVPKEVKADKTVNQISAYVGGSSSFDVLSMKLKLHRRQLVRTWSHEKQAYFTSKVLSNEVVKPKSDGKTYKGYASYITENESKAEDDLVVLAANDSKDKKKNNEFYILSIGYDLQIKETSLGLTGAQTLVYTDQLIDSKDIVMIFAPDKGEGDPTNYTYFKFSQKGELKNKVSFKSPSGNLLIMSVNEANGSVYFCGTSTKSKDAYSEIFSEYASIVSPGFKDANNILDAKWLKKADEKMDNFHFLKFTENQLIFASTAPIDAFKSKFKTAPSGKGASVYKGRKFFVEKFYITPTQEYLIGGQLTGSTNLGMGNPVKTYEDLVCLYFDNNGNLKTQFGVEKLNNDKKSEIFDMAQNFRLGKDGKSLYWEIMEVKGVKGYESFLAAYYNGQPDLYPVYFPRIAKLDLQSNTLSDFKILGNEKYFIRKDVSSYFNEKENSRTYIGHDDDFKKIWLSKYVFE